MTPNSSTPQAVIVSTGNEILSGAVVDTNAAFISSRLFPMDIRVRLMIVAGDDCDTLEHVLRIAVDAAEIVIISGGLGPTDDDNTIEALRRLIGFRVVVDAAASGRIEKFFQRMGRAVSQSDIKMAEVPECARIIPNENGLAPGFILQNNGKVIIAMPGVPREMKEMVDRYIIPYLRDECGIAERSHIRLRVVGMKESEINEAVRGIRDCWAGCEWGITMVDGVATVTFASLSKAIFNFTHLIEGLKKQLGDRMLDSSFTRPEEEVVERLRRVRRTVAFAESCTGGLASKRVTDIPGASDVFAGCVVAYRNDAKESLLGVARATLEAFGAVSEETAIEMAKGARQVFQADIGVSITGIAGPGGGTEEKPVGTVWFCIADEAGVKTARHRFAGDRERVRIFASLTAIELLRSRVKDMS